MDDLDATLGEYYVTRDFYRGRVDVDDTSVAFIFISNFMLPRLNDADQLLMDGTFAITPIMHPRFSQMFNIFIRRINQVFYRFILSFLVPFLSI